MKGPVDRKKDSECFASVRGVNAGQGVAEAVGFLHGDVAWEVSSGAVSPAVTIPGVVDQVPPALVLYLHSRTGGGGTAFPIVNEALHVVEDSLAG